jgi:hypothetical protein
MSKEGQNGQPPAVTKDVNLKLEAFFQINKDDIANIAVSRIENQLNDFIEGKQKDLRELNDQRNSASAALDELKEKTIEAAEKSSHLIELARYIQDTLINIHGKRELKSEINVSFHREFAGLQQESEMRKFLDAPQAQGLFFAKVTGKATIPVAERIEYYSVGDFNLALSTETVPGAPGLINQILDAAKERDKIIQKISETTQLITDARGQLADIDRIIREARAAVSQAAMNRSEGGDEIMQVINQIPGFNRLNRLIGSP